MFPLKDEQNKKSYTSRKLEKKTLFHSQQMSLKENQF